MTEQEARDLITILSDFLSGQKSLPEDYSDFYDSLDTLKERFMKI